MAVILKFLGGLVPRLAGGGGALPDGRVTKGSILVLDDLYRREGPEIMRSIARRSDPQDAEDILHDSIVRLADAMAEEKPVVVRPGALLNSISTNIQKDRARSAFERARARSVPIEDVDLQAPDMTSTLEARDMIARIQKALKRLNPKTCEIFLAHRVDGQSYGEIADRMGMSVKGVEWHMSKAICHLDRTLRSL